MKSKEKGITLIALVVTIIILIILSAITINVLFGDNGLIKKANKSKELTEQASAEEQVRLAYFAALAKGEGVYDKNSFESEILKIGASAVTSLNSLPVTVKLNGRLVTINASGGIQAVKWYMNDNQKITNGEIEIALGTTIKYDCGDIDSRAQTTYTSSRDNGNGYNNQTFDLRPYAKNGANELTWKVIGVENGQILIIPTTNISTSTNEQFSLYGSTGYINGVTQLDQICKLYAQGKGADTEKSRSIRVEDINRLLKYNPENVKYGAGTISEYGKDVTYYWDGTNYPSYESTNGSKGKLGSIHSNFAWIDGTNYKTEAKSTEGVPHKIATIKNTYYEYVCSDYKANLVNEDVYDLLFNVHGYWLGNQWVTANAKHVSYDLLIAGIESNQDRNLVSSDNGEAMDAFFVRPIVYLDSNVDISSMM